MNEASEPAKSVAVGIVGVSGYSGMELARVLASHPSFQLSLVTHLP